MIRAACRVNMLDPQLRANILCVCVCVCVLDFTGVLIVKF